MFPMGQLNLFKKGSFELARTCVEVHRDALRNVIREPDQDGERFSYLFFSGGGE